MKRQWPEVGIGIVLVALAVALSWASVAGCGRNRGERAKAGAVPAGTGTGSGGLGAPPPSPVAMAVLTDLRTRFGSAALPAAGVGAAPATETAATAAEAAGPMAMARATTTVATARVRTPDLAAEPFRLEDAETGMAVQVSLRGARGAGAERAGEYTVYPNGDASGATLLRREMPGGVEDFVDFEQPPATPEIMYDLTLEKGIAGLRLVAGTLEMIDEGGAPRLRVEPPALVAEGGEEIPAALEVTGCAVDTDPASPWDRPVTAPGAATCAIRVSWPADEVEYPALLDPTWTTTIAMNKPRQGHTATVLANGNVLVVGGSDGTNLLASAELFNPPTRTWATTNPMTGARQLHTATLLGTTASSKTSGAVLIAGGLNGSTSLDTAQLYSPSGTWAAAGKLNAARHGHTATLLSNGKVLVTGGLNGGNTLQSAAIYDPGSGAGIWTATTGPIPPTGQKAHTATRLVTSNSQLNNKVLLPGGNSGTGTLDAVYLFDPAQSAFSTLAAMPSRREGHTATLLADGRLLLAGGKNGTTPLRSAVIFDPGFGPGSWSTTGNMTVVRVGHTATLLPDGRVLVVGGSSGGPSLPSAELFTPSPGTWAATAPMPAGIEQHTATPIGTKGLVLIAGGVKDGVTMPTSRLYDLTGGNSCSSGTQCATGFCVNGVCCNMACTDQCSACNLAGSVGLCSPRLNGTSCNDANACTQTDTCQAGACTGTNPKVCSGSDQCHVGGTCNPSTGACSNPPKPDGSSCNDGNACSQTDICQAGTCTGTNPRICVPLDQCHVAGACAPATGACTNPPTVDGVTCDDGNACTLSESCQAGSCVGGMPKVCVAADQCHLPGTCAPTTGMCSNPTKTNGAACNDGSACTRNETCQGGACVAGTAVANGLACDDGDPCTQADACQAGQCVGITGLACTQTKIDDLRLCPGRSGSGTSAVNQGWWQL